MEKCVLFLVDATPAASPVPEAKDWDAEATAAKEDEETALTAMKAAWHAAKEARQVGMLRWSNLSIAFGQIPCADHYELFDTPLNIACTPAIH